MGSKELEGFKIVVLDNGFVYVGDVCRTDEDTFVINNARNVRVWGTDKGLGQLALSGPTKQTILDDVGCVAFMKHAHQHSIATCASKWKR